MRKYLFLVVTILTSTFMLAQESLFGGADIKSPEIHKDKTVTFRIVAPNATEVKLSGDWMPSEGWTPGSVAMQKDEKGLWLFTTNVLKPELYSYSISIDGFSTTDPNNAFFVRDVASVKNIFLIDGEQADLYKVNDVPHGSVTKRWYDSPGIDKKRRLTIYTPPSYDKSNKNYPVLYLLHGAGGDEEAWTSLGRATQILDNLISEGKAKPMIVVMPNGNVSQEAAPGEGIRGYYKPQFMETGTMNGMYEESFIDIMNFVKSNFRIKEGKGNTAIAGLSMGGFHSLHISRYYPNTFDYVGLFSAAIMPSQDASSKVYQNFDETLEVQKNNGYKLYWIAIGKTDFLYKNVIEYKDKLDKIEMPYVYKESDGGHIWKNWRIYLSEFAPMLFN